MADVNNHRLFTMIPVQICSVPDEIDAVNKYFVTGAG